MKIIHIDGAIGSGKTSIDYNARNQKGVLYKRTNEFGYILTDNIVFVGNSLKKNSDEIRHFGGLDDYCDNYSKDWFPLLHELKQRPDETSLNVLLAKVCSFKTYVRYMAEFPNDSLNFIFCMRPVKRILKQRNKRRNGQGHYAIDEEIEGIKRNIDELHRRISKIREYAKNKNCNNVNITEYTNDVVFSDRVKTTLNLLGIQQVGSNFKRTFY